MVELVIFNGVRYRRYAHSKYFTAGIADIRNGASSLHRDTWIAANGPIPDGHDIHHIDGDAANNDLTNLQLLTVSEHQAIHTAERHASGWYRTPEKLAHVERIRPLTKAWHASEEGRAWHREHGKEVWKGRKPQQFTCDHCKAGFESLKPTGNRFCSNKCKSAARRASGVDDVDRSCCWCGESFKVNRYSKAGHCSRTCAQRARAAKA